MALARSGLTRRLFHHPVQPLLFLRQGSPRALHAQERDFDVFVSGLFGEEGAA